MDVQLNQIWEKTITIIKGELSEVSFNTWIKSITPLSLSSSTIKLCVPNNFTKEILESRYKDLIFNALKMLTSKQFNIEFLIGEENSTEEKIPKKSNLADRSINLPDE
ncbi:DnaA N-terminal domain-containing protein, partial [Hathewaya histolytica]